MFKPICSAKSSASDVPAVWVLFSIVGIWPAVNHPVTDGGLPITPLEALIYLKLKSSRKKDEADVIELLRIHDPKLVRRYLEKNAPDMLPKFDSAATEALEEH